MPNYIRNYVPGGLFFFTVKVAHQHPLFSQHVTRRLLHEAFTFVRREHPLSIEAVVLLPDHLHCIWQMPEGEANYSIRWGRIKRRFSQLYRAAGLPMPNVGASMGKRREGGLFQRRFWEHTLRDEDDFKAHLDYIHYNPIKHGHTVCAHAWPYSSFTKWVERGEYAADWLCNCSGRPPVATPPWVDNLDVGE
ncbi:transposase [bacterium]|nr:transposase [bacterium]